MFLPFYCKTRQGCIKGNYQLPQKDIFSTRVEVQKNLQKVENQSSSERLLESFEDLTLSAKSFLILRDLDFKSLLEINHLRGMRGLTRTL